MKQMQLRCFVWERQSGFFYQSPPVPSADSVFKAHAPLPKAAAVVTPAVVVEDDTEYASVDDDDIGSDGRTAF